MKRVSVAFALSAALVAFSSPQTLDPESRWVAFSFRGGEKAYGPVSVEAPTGLAAEETTIHVPLDEETTIVLAEGSLAVERQGEEVWASHPSWDVRQLLVADVNNDGEQEAAFVLWKPFHLEPTIIYDNFGFPSLWQEGSLRNHLFLYGWRDAAWQRLWCSSPVADPILELAAGDVDGDGANELVVLEGSYEAPDPPARHISVWRWNGWGFTLRWRGPGGLWHDLLLQDVSADGVLDVLVREPN
jgi:hypothetical protein